MTVQSKDMQLDDLLQEIHGFWQQCAFIDNSAIEPKEKYVGLLLDVDQCPEGQAFFKWVQQFPFPAEIPARRVAGGWCCTSANDLSLIEGASGSYAKLGCRVETTVPGLEQEFIFYVLFDLGEERDLQTLEMLLDGWKLALILSGKWTVVGMEKLDIGRVDTTGLEDIIEHGRNLHKASIHEPIVAFEEV